MSAIAINSAEEWHSIREQNIGGSEVACLFYQFRLPNEQVVVRHMFEPVLEGAVNLGCLGSAGKTGYRLWFEKAGKVMPDDLSEVERVVAGNHMEPAIAAWSQEKWDWKLRKVRRYMTHPTVAGWGATRDYEIVGEAYPPVEVKNVDYLVFRDKWISERDEILTPPIHINLQLQAQIGVDPKCKEGWIVACVGGNKLYRGRIERHEATQQRIAEAITAFWASINAGIEPVAFADADTVSEAYAVGEKGLAADLTQDPMLDRDAAMFLRWKAHLDFVEKHVGHLKARLTSRLKDAEFGAGVNYSLKWPAVHVPSKSVPATITKEKNYRGGLFVIPATK